jgi:hypothetical protein
LQSNAAQRIKDLNDERNTDRRRINDLLKEKADKDMNIQILHAQLEALKQHQQAPVQLNTQQQHQFHAMQLQLQRLTEENSQLNQRLSQQQQHFQQQHLSSINAVNTNDSGNMQLRVMSEHMKKLSVDNANMEKKVAANELLIKQLQKDKEDIYK